MKKPKYMRRVFSGKDVPVIGLDQGKSPLYRGDGVGSIFNLTFDSTLELRFGTKKHSEYGGSISSADRLDSVRFVCEGTNIHMEEA